MQNNDAIGIITATRVLVLNKHFLTKINITQIGIIVHSAMFSVTFYSHLDDQSCNIRCWINRQFSAVITGAPIINWAIFAILVTVDCGLIENKEYIAQILL